MDKEIRFGSVIINFKGGAASPDIDRVDGHYIALFYDDITRIAVRHENEKKVFLVRATVLVVCRTYSGYEMYHDGDEKEFDINNEGKVTPTL